MRFAWPYALFLVLAAPLLWATYLLLLHRRRRFAVTYSSLSLLREALPATSRWRRRLPMALFLVALVTLGIAAARPQAVVAVPISRTSIILALDVSGSMCSTDVTPNRLTAAQRAARSFIEAQPAGTQIGLVAFSGVAQVLVPPTSDRQQLLSAIAGLKAGRGTAIGTAILRSIDAIAEINPDVQRTGLPAGSAPASRPSQGYEPDIVILLTDGATTQGIDPLQAAQEAADRRVRIYSIGFGTTAAAALQCSRDQLGSDVFSGQFGFTSRPADGIRRSYLALDEKTLRGIAGTTGGTYHRASDADQLTGVFRNLPTDIVLQKQQVEISFAFAGLGAALATAAVGLSLAWNRYG